MDLEVRTVLYGRQSLLYRELKDRGIRLTPQRMAILEYLRETTSHPRADQVHQQVRHRFPGVSLATVYNNLKILKDKGLVNELRYGDLASRFDGKTDPHYHVNCQVCGTVVDFHGQVCKDLHGEAAKVTKFEISGHRIELYGACPDCRGKDIEPS